MDDFLPMHPTALKFGIPDLELGCSSGTKVNPASFAGHELIALFCPLDPAAAGQEIATYRKHCAEFVERDAWLLTFAEDFGDLSLEGVERVLMISDPERRAWVAFRNLTAHPQEMDRDSGATFLFTRGGGLHRYWHGAGHVEDVLSELRIPASQHPHQLAR
ncbi:MAG TPA: hypothetical protein VJ846_04905 [Sphingomicrobium sp.]|nr:hypothetical protein [Sphingomicrobium sp.]